MNKISKGDFGYIENRKKRECLKTILMFLVPLALFFAGMMATKTRLNLLTVVAVLGMLPASKSAVLMIMYLKGHGISQKEYDDFEEQMGNLQKSYDNIFTAYDFSIEVPSLVVRAGNICGICNQKSKNLSQLEKHIETTLRQEGYHVNCKIFDKKQQYLERLKSLRELEETEKEQATTLGILQVLHDISL